MNSGIISWILKFADDTKVFGKVDNAGVIKNAERLKQTLQLTAGLANDIQCGQMQSYASRTEKLAK